MANTNIDTAMEVYAAKVIAGLTPALAPLKAFSLDLSEEMKQEGESVLVPLVTADAAGAWNDSSNNYTRPTAVLKGKRVTVNKRIIAGFGIEQQQLANFRPNYWERKGELNAEAVAAAVLEETFAIVTPGNYGDTEKDKLTVAYASFGRGAVAELRPLVVRKGLKPARSVLVLNPDFFSALLSSLDATVYGGREAIVGGVVPGLLGFRAIIEAPQLEEPGFVAHPDAIAIGARRVPVADTTPYKEFGPLLEPETGLTLNKVVFTEGAVGKTSASIECLFGVDVGNKKALLRLVA